MTAHGSHFPPRKKQAEEGTDAWLMTYADMITLLLCFFIIFVAISEPKEEKLAALTKGVQSKFGAMEMATPFMGVFRAIQGVIENNSVFRELAVEKTEKGVTVEISTNVFFQELSADFNPDMLPVLTEMAEAFKETEFQDYTIEIEGHTDDVDITTSLFASNWELSAGRAARVVRFLIDQGLAPEAMQATGFGSAQPKVPNADQDGKPITENREQNRRIIIRLERKK